VKRFFIAISALFYLAIASGVPVNMHYCMGKLASVDYGHTEEGNCGKCGMPDSGSACCHTESAFIKLQDDHQLSSAHFSFKQPQAPAVLTPVYEVPQVKAYASIPGRSIHAPPDDASPAVYLYNCVFRI
jgi:hypothetical protein